RGIGKMLTCRAMSSMPEAKGNLRSCSDAQLLAAVGQQRDRAAFAELYGRYERAAHSLALHLTGNAAAAEDAFQEAMLRLWTSASSYRPGNSKAWILSIVARESLRMIRSKKRNQKETEIAAGEPQLDMPNEGLEQGELLTAVTRVVESLPQLERRLIALRYAAGMSQYEIARELS